MKIFLAGGISGNLKPLFRRAIIEYDKNGFKNLNLGDYMKVFLAGQAPWKETGLYDNVFKNNSVYILESFYYADEWTEKYIPLFKDFLLDSGAFSTFSNIQKAKNIVWDSYLTRYISFIKRNNVKSFFELDIDCVVGLKKVEDFRKRIEDEIQIKPIPVWHSNRGWDYFLRMCEEYSYVAIGTTTANMDGKLGRKNPSIYAKFVNTAHRMGCKIHGLGFTLLSELERIKFDSVDSTAWTCGNRFGYVYFFDGYTMQKRLKKKGERLGDSKKVALHNFIEWVKFQQYAERCL